MKDKTAKKRSTGAVNRVLMAHKTLKTQLVKMTAEDRELVIKALLESTADLTKFVNTQLAVPGKFEFPDGGE